MTWKNNVIGHSVEDPEQLLAHHANPRRHGGKQRDAIRESLDRLGIIDSVKVNDRTGNLINGHMRVEEYITKGIKKIPVEHVDLSEEEELEAITYYDAIGVSATYEPEVLENNLTQIALDEGVLTDLLTDLKPTIEYIPLDFSDIEGTQDRQGKKEQMTVTCPSCEHQFQV